MCLANQIKLPEGAVPCAHASAPRRDITYVVPSAQKNRTLYLTFEPALWDKNFRIFQTALRIAAVLWVAHVRLRRAMEHAVQRRVPAPRDLPERRSCSNKSENQKEKTNSTLDSEL